MTNDEIVKAIAENTQRSKSNSHRIDDLEKNGELLHKMVTALEVLATQQKNVAEQVERIDSKVTRLEESPMRRIRTIVGYSWSTCSRKVSAPICSKGSARR